MVEEIRNHLDDGVAAHMREGAPREHAVSLAIAELGRPDTVAAEFHAAGVGGSDSADVVRWLPLLPPLFLFAVRVGFLVSSVEWFADGWTVGERTTQQAYFWGAVAAGALAYGAYFSLRRAPSDPAWRWGAWACTCLALVMATVAPF